MFKLSINLNAKLRSFTSFIVPVKLAFVLGQKNINEPFIPEWTINVIFFNNVNTFGNSNFI
ncbi:MAG: hypothetical protein SNJ77_01460 [Cytophagales bacterium]